MFVGCFDHLTIVLGGSTASYFEKGPCDLPQANLDVIPYDLWIFDGNFGAVYGIEFANNGASAGNEYTINYMEGPFPICIPPTAK